MAVKKSKLKRKSGNGKSAASKVAAKKLPSVKDPMTKSGILKAVTESTGVAKKDVVAIFGCLEELIAGHVKSRGPGVFVMPGLLKVTVVKKPARPARKGINPFTGEETVFKAKPAHKVVKIKALKKLKAMVD